MIRHRWSIKLFVFLLLIMSNDVFAMNFTLKSYQELRLKKDDLTYLFFKSWLDGIYNGLVIADVFGSDLNNNSIFCQPEKLALTEENLEDIINRYIKTRQIKPDSDLAIILVFALQEVFPCQK